MAPSRPAFLAVVATFITAVWSHTVITYPGWRGDNLVTNETFPYGMQWMYPCGGIKTTTNRTLWPVTGGTIALQPGWFQGHATAFMYINLGFGTDGPDGGPPNMSFPMVPVLQIVGPSRNPYPGTICLPQVSLPVNASVNVGDNATIQVVETAVHGAALYSCVDITFADPHDPNLEEVTKDNCFNSSVMGFNTVYSSTLVEGQESAAVKSGKALSWGVLVLAIAWGWGWLL